MQQPAAPTRSRKNPRAPSQVPGLPAIEPAAAAKPAPTARDTRTWFEIRVHEPAGSDAEGEWEMVTREGHEHAAAVADTSNDGQEPPWKEPACASETAATASAGATSGGVDVGKGMEMVAALCKQSARQCAVIGTLVERVGALERAVRRMEDAESRRRRAMNLNTESK